MSALTVSCKITRPVLFIAFFVTAAAATSGAFAQSSKPRVQAQTVRIHPVIKKIELSGTVTSPRVSQISTSVEGLVRDVHFDSGAKVKRGDALLDLDSEVEQAALRQAKAQTAQAAAELADAQRRLKIAKNLAKKAFGPQNDVEAREAEIEMDSAALASAEAGEQRNAAIVERHHLKAPFDGVIAKKMVEVGQWVKPGTAVFELVSMSDLRIDVPVPQNYYSELQRDVDVALRFDAVPDVVVSASVSAIIPISDPEARTFTVRIVSRDNQLPIAPGMSARITLNIQSGVRNIAVSRDALIRYPDGRVSVWVVTDDGDSQVVEERNVEIGVAFDGLVQIRKGLKEGDKVVVRGNESLRQGQSVQTGS